MKKVVLAGGTGFIGEYFNNKFKELGYDVKIISRQMQHISWEDKDGIKEVLEDAELLINLAGKSVNCRYNETNKNEIMNSRIRTTTLLGEAIQACENPPEILDEFEYSNHLPPRRRSSNDRRYRRDWNWFLS